MKQIHILIISQYFYPEPLRINDIAIEWVRRGYKVSVLTGIPNYPQGRFYRGYGYGKRRHETWNGIEITRIPLFPRGQSSIGMVANYASFLLSGLLWVNTHKVKADLIFSFEISPMTQVMIGCKARNKYHIPHFLYVQDLWPENVESVTGIHSPIVIKPINKMADYIYKNTDYIFATSPSFVETIVNRSTRVPRSKVHYWPQYAEQVYHPLNRETARTDAQKGDAVNQIPDDDSFKIIFTGNIGMAQGLDILPKTARRMKQSNQSNERRTKFIIVGDGRYKDRFIKEIQDNGVKDMFTLISHQNKEEIPKLLACCDAAFVSFQDDELWKKTIPAKLQSYMACGIPIIASAQGETERIINEAGCGLCCKTGDADKLRAAIASFLEMTAEERKEMGDRAHRYAMIHFDKEKLLDEVDEWLQIATKVNKQRTTKRTGSGQLSFLSFRAKRGILTQNK